MNPRAFLFIALSAIAAAGATAQTVYGFNLRAPSNFRTFSAATPLTQTVLGVTPNNVFGCDFDSGGTLYAATGPAAGTAVLNTVNLATGAFTSSVNITGMLATENVTGITFGSGNAAFLSANSATGTNLYSLNTGTGALTLIGAMGGTNIMIDISADNAGNLFGMDISTDSLWSISSVTGAATLIGATGFATNFAQGMDFDPVSNVLYATLYTGGGTGNFASINTATGVATSIASTTTLNIEMEMAIAPEAVPEPATMAVLGLGVAALLRRRKKN